MMIILKAVVKLKKILEREQKMTSLNKLYLIPILEIQMSGLMILGLIFTFSIKDIAKTSLLLNQL